MFPLLLRNFLNLNLARDSYLPIYLTPTEKSNYPGSIRETRAQKLLHCRWHIMIYLEKENCFKNKAKAKKVLKIFNFCVLIEIVEFLKVSQSRKQILTFSFGPKKTTKIFLYFCPSFKKILKKWSKQKIRALKN